MKMNRFQIAALRQGNFGSHISEVVRDSHKGAMAFYKIECSFCGGNIPVTILVTPSQAGDAALVSTLFWNKHASNGVLSTRDWRWRDFRCDFRPSSAYEAEAVEYLYSNRARPAA